MGALALSRARLTKALALDAAVGAGAVAGCPELEASSEGVEALLLTLACRIQGLAKCMQSQQAAALLLCGGTCDVAEVGGMEANAAGCGWGRGGAFVMT